MKIFEVSVLFLSDVLELICLFVLSCFHSLVLHAPAWAAEAVEDYYIYTWIWCYTRISKESFCYNSCVKQSQCLLVKLMNLWKKSVTYMKTCKSHFQFKNNSLLITIWEVYCYSLYTNFWKPFCIRHCEDRCLHSEWLYIRLTQ